MLHCFHYIISAIVVHTLFWCFHCFWTSLDTNRPKILIDLVYIFDIKSGQNGQGRVIKVTHVSFSKNCFSRKSFTAWNVSKYGVISGPYFPVFGLNTGKYWPEITLYLGTFHAVIFYIENHEYSNLLYQFTLEISFLPKMHPKFSRNQLNSFLLFCMKLKGIGLLKSPIYLYIFI